MLDNRPMVYKYCTHDCFSMTIKCKRKIARFKPYSVFAWLSKTTLLQLDKSIFKFLYLGSIQKRLQVQRKFRVIRTFAHSVIHNKSGHVRSYGFHHVFSSKPIILICMISAYFFLNNCLSALREPCRRHGRMQEF